jgi:hypothetical protein
MISDAQAVVTDLLSKKILWPQMLLEDYLTVAIGLRRCSLVTIPAEWPDAETISRRIDEACIGDLRQLAQERDVKKKMKMIRSVKEKMRKTSLEEIRSSPSYNSHISWINRLGLEAFEVEIRPTVRELFMYKEKDMKGRIENLMRKRQRFREEFLKHADQSTPRSIAAYPEERYPEYLTEIGGLLAYPACCVKAYIEGRRKENLSAEQRAAAQISDVRALGLEPDVYVYFSKDFIPCSPTCVNASVVGGKSHQALATLDGRLSDFHLQCLKKNVDAVGSYVQRIEEHKAKISLRSKELGIETVR